jgi:hypothetical protein
MCRTINIVRSILVYNFTVACVLIFTRICTITVRHKIILVFMHYFQIIICYVNINVLCIRFKRMLFYLYCIHLRFGTFRMSCYAFLVFLYVQLQVPPIKVYFSSQVERDIINSIFSNFYGGKLNIFSKI